ncbi:MAG: hypothetical protein IPF99_21975 [Deltaproteobacteria bacterium]|nr:hypothetical protein [Deltaproteobacteria bacterium]
MHPGGWTSAARAAGAEPLLTGRGRPYDESTLRRAADQLDAEGCSARVAQAMWDQVGRLFAIEHLRSRTRRPLPAGDLRGGCVPACWRRCAWARGSWVGALDPGAIGTPAQHTNTPRRSFPAPPCPPPVRPFAAIVVPPAAPSGVRLSPLLNLGGLWTSAASSTTSPRIGSPVTQSFLSTFSEESLTSCTDEFVTSQA